MSQARLLNRIPAAAIAVGLLVALGCSSSGKAPAASNEGNRAKINTWLASQAVDMPANVYHVAPPDKLRVVSPNVKELDGQPTVIRPDGNITLNLIGDVHVAGLTPAEISEVIAQKLSKYYKASSIDISVQVVEYKSRVYYVFGQVLAPGIKPYTGSDTVVRVLADAKLNQQAWPEKIVIVRPNEDVNVKQRVTVDVKEMYENGNVQQNFLIEAGDVVYVPPSPLAEVSMTFKKLLFPVIPATNIGGLLLRGGI